MMKLVVLDGPMRGREFPLGESAAVIGRDPGADISLAMDPRISPFHCQISFERGQYWLEDLGSSRGTRVYGKPYDRQMPLFGRDVFRVGDTRLCVIDGSLSAEEQNQLLARHAPKPAGRAVRPISPALALAPDAEEESLRFAVADPAAMLLQVQAGDPPEVQRVVTRLRVLQEVTADLAGLVDTTAILEKVVERVMRVVRAERAMAFLVAPGASQADLPPAVVRRRNETGEARGPVVPSRSVVRRVLRDRMAVLVSDVYADQRLEPSQSLVQTAYRSILCAPMLRKDELRALLYLDSTEPHAFSREELELVVVMANQAAAALLNAQLYEQLRAAYRDLETAHDQLVQTEKLATIGGLAASISHDIGNVLTPISGVAAMVMGSDVVPPPLKEAFDRQMRRLQALASQLLSFSSPRPPEMVAVDLNTVIRDSLLLVQTEARHHHVEIDLRLAPELPLVKADPNRLDQAAVNIMLNAFQAMQGGGGRLTLSSGVVGERVFLSFADTGPGIPETHLALLGKPFFTTKGRRGNGLGVYGTKRIVEEEHGGTLGVSSRLGEGTTFTIELPLAQPGG